MTPKEKAEQVINSYIDITADGNFPSDLCKQCALIAVDEVLKIMRNEYFEESEAVQYWVKVKQEIEKL